MSLARIVEETEAIEDAVDVQAVEQLEAIEDAVGRSGNERNSMARSLFSGADAPGLDSRISMDSTPPRFTQFTVEIERDGRRRCVPHGCES